MRHPPSFVRSLSRAMMTRPAQLNLANSAAPRQEILGNSKVNIFDQPIEAVATARVIAEAKTLANDHEAFTLVNIDALYVRYRLWRQQLPQIEPFYAMKANNDEAIIRTLAALGVGFDCASKAEIDTVLRLGVSPDRIIYANPIKTPAYMVHAESQGVNLITFDSIEELDKISAYHRKPELVVRIAVADASAAWPLTGKFGADPEAAAPELLKRAAELGIPVIGVCFHVGSGCNDPTSIVVGLQHAKHLIQVGYSFGHRMSIVDIGGGFPGDNNGTPFEKIAACIRPAISSLIAEHHGVRVIAEPGTFFAARPCSIAVNVIGRKAVAADRITRNVNDDGSTGHMYYINDGMFGSFICVAFGQPKSGKPLFTSDGKLYPATIWGPTCDSVDRIENNVMLPKLEVGDWLLYDDMGAYSSVCASTFNGFHSPKPIYVVSEAVWKMIGM